MNSQKIQGIGMTMADDIVGFFAEAHTNRILDDLEKVLLVCRDRLEVGLVLTVDVTRRT